MHDFSNEPVNITDINEEETTMEEVKNAIKKLLNGKSAGLDGTTKLKCLDVEKTGGRRTSPIMQEGLKK